MNIKIYRADLTDETRPKSTLLREFKRPLRADTFIRAQVNRDIQARRLTHIHIEVDEGYGGGPDTFNSDDWIDLEMGQFFSDALRRDREYRAELKRRGETEYL